MAMVALRGLPRALVARRWPEFVGAVSATAVPRGAERGCRDD